MNDPLEAQESVNEGYGPSRCSVSLALAILLLFVVPSIYLVSLLIYAAWVIHWSIGVGAAMVLVVIALPEGHAEKWNDHNQW